MDRCLAAILDLDGVLTRTAALHARAWKRTFDAFLARRPAREGENRAPFEIETDYRRQVDGVPRLDGVRRFLASRGITLPEGSPEDGPDADTVHGLAAHAGICPEQGMSAIRIAAEAIAAMRLGRLDAETTANLGIIQGGLAGNIVPASLTVRGETRSLSPDKLEAQTAHMRRCFDEAAARHAVRVGDREHRARVEAQVERQYSRLDVRDDAGIVRLVQSAARAAGRTCPTRGTGGGSDANVFAERGLEVANLACGMREIHTVNEWVDVRDLVLTAGLVLETVRLNAAV